MSLRSTVASAVNTAFRAAGDLIESATLERESVTGYNFLNEETTGTEQPITIDVLRSSRQTSENSNVITTFYAKESDVDLSKYSTLTIGAESFNIENINRDIGVVTITGRSR